MLNISAFQKHRRTTCLDEPASASGLRFISCSTVSVTYAPANEMQSAITAQNSKARRSNNGTLASTSASTPNAANHNQYENDLYIIGFTSIFRRLKVVFTVYFTWIPAPCQAEFSHSYQLSAVSNQQSFFGCLPISSNRLPPFTSNGRENYRIRVHVKFSCRFG